MSSFFDELTDEDDISSNKGYAILSYILILILIPIFAARKSKFAMFHANQGIAILLGHIALGFAEGFLKFFTPGFLDWIITISAYGGRFFLIWMAVQGVLAAASGQMKKIPFLGGITFLR